MDTAEGAWYWTPEELAGLWERGAVGPIPLLSTASVASVASVAADSVASSAHASEGEEEGARSMAGATEEKEGEGGEERGEGGTEGGGGGKGSSDGLPTCMTPAEFRQALCAFSVLSTTTSGDAGDGDDDAGCNSTVDSTVDALPCWAVSHDEALVKVRKT